MSKQSCPHLGLEYDPATFRAYPDEGNCCHKNGVPRFIILEFQNQVCLNEGHTHCPVFTGGDNSIQSPYSSTQRLPGRIKKVFLAFVGVFLLIILAAALFMSKVNNTSANFSSSDRPTQTMTRTVANTIVLIEKPIDTATMPYLGFPLIIHQPTLTPTRTLIPSPTATLTPEPTQTARINLRPTQIRRIPQPTSRPVKPTKTSISMPTPPPFRPTIQP